jgi:repressor LexA
MRVITINQMKVLVFIKDFINRNSYSPTIREIASNFSVSIRAASDSIFALKRKGYIKTEPKKPRTITVIREG